MLKVYVLSGNQLSNSLSHSHAASRRFLENIIRDAVTYTEHAYAAADSKPVHAFSAQLTRAHLSHSSLFSLRRRKTVYTSDIVMALRRQGRTLCTMRTATRTLASKL